MRRDEESGAWKPATPQIANALEKLMHCVRAMGVKRIPVSVRHNALLDARVHLLRLHRKRMLRTEDRRRADRTISHLQSQKVVPRPDGPLPVWSK